MSVINKLVDIAKNQIDIYKAAVKKYAPSVDVDGLNFKCNQLFDVESEKIINGNSTIESSDNGYVIKYTCSNIYEPIRIRLNASLFKPNTTYSLIVDEKPENCTIQFSASVSFSNLFNNELSNGTSNSITIGNIDLSQFEDVFIHDAYLAISMFVGNSDYVGEQIIKGLRLVEGGPKEWEPYTSLDSIRTKIKAKNLFDISKLTLTNKEKPESSGNVSEIGDRYIVITTIDAYEGNGYTNTGHKLKEVCPDLVVGETYTLTANTQTKVQTCMYIGTSWYFGKSITITEEMLNAYVCFYGYSTSHGEKRGSCKISDITIVKGTKPGTWSPYNVTTLYKLSAIKKNLERIYDAVVRKYATIKSVSGSGVISVTDSADYKPLDLKIYGKSEQKQYEGYNVLDIRNKTKSANGITCTVNEEGVITVSGTTQTTEGSAYTFEFDVDISLLKIGTEYITNIYCERTEGGSKKYDKTFVMSEDITSVRCYIHKKVSDYINGEIFYPVLCESKYDPNIFEPFTGNEPSPSINYPQPTNHLGESGSIEGKFIGENLIDVTGIVGRAWATELDNSVKTTINGDELIVEVLRRSNNIIIPLLKKVRGSWSRYMEFTFSDGITENRKWSIMMDSSAYGGELYSSGEGSGNYYIGGNTYYVNRIQIGCGDVWFEAGTTITLTRSYVNETGNGFTPYIVPQPFTALTPNGFMGLKTLEINLPYVNYIDANGNSIIGNEKSYEEGKNKEWVHEYDFSELKFGSNTMYGENGYTEFSYISPKKCLTHDYQSLCTHFKRKYTWRFDEEYFYASDTYVRFYTNKFTTREEFEAWANEQAENGTPLKIVVALQDPIVTDLAEDELEQYNALRMNQPNTTILNDGGAGMELDYVVAPE